MTARISNSGGSTVLGDGVSCRFTRHVYTHTWHKWPMSACVGLAHSHAVSALHTAHHVKHVCAGWDASCYAMLTDDKTVWMCTEVRESGAPLTAYRAGDFLQDAAWFPGAASGAPALQALVVAERGAPVCMVRAADGQQTATYRTLSLAHEPTGASAVSIAADGAHVHAAVGRQVRAVVAVRCILRVPPWS